MILLALLMTAAPLKVDTKALKADLVKLHGEAQQTRIDQGVDQVAALWRKDDGDLAAFVKSSEDDLIATAIKAARHSVADFQTFVGRLPGISAGSTAYGK